MKTASYYFIAVALLAASLRGSDFIYVGAGQSLYHVDCDSGGAMLVASGGLLSDVDGILYAADGMLYVADNQGEKIVQVDPVTGQQSLVISRSVGWGWHMAEQADGNILIGGDQTIWRLDARGGSTTNVASGGMLTDVDGVTVGGDGNLYVANNQGEQVVSINPESGEQALFSKQHVGWGWYMATETDTTIIVGGGSTIWRLNTTDRSMTRVSSAGLLTDIDGLAISPAGRLYIADNQGATIVKVDLVTGNQVLVASGQSLGWHLASSSRYRRSVRPPSFLTPSRVSEDATLIQLSSPDRAAWIIESTEDLRSWRPVVTNWADGGFLDYIDRETAVRRMRLYRARLLD